ncbi:MAG TPA: hypothetical protein ENN89_01045 [Synergistetes bacterium]|nr:hypothetical protein [Synergistota bacterium]
MVNSGTRGESGFFYRYLFAALCFSSLAAGILMGSPTAFLLVLLFGALSRTAAKKSWPDPPFAEKLNESLESFTTRKDRVR